jgi:hypothetical protein
MRLAPVVEKVTFVAILVGIFLSFLAATANGGKVLDAAKAPAAAEGTVEGKGVWIALAN